MKRKPNQILRYLPVTAFIAASLPFTAQADIIVDDGEGNVDLSLSTGAFTIRANGADILTPNPTPTVDIGASVNLTGSVANTLETEVLEITAAGYTVTNAGTLAGSAHQGISSTFAFTLNNSGTISAAGLLGDEGIAGVGGTTSITNSGTISGTDDAIYFTANGGTIINSSMINGITGANSDGIDAMSNVIITNNNGGTIQGLNYGINVEDGLNLTNNRTATITGTNNSGVYALATATINNYGSISGTSGISVTDTATINNKFSELGLVDAGGSIIGTGGNGITAGASLTLTNESLGLIRGSTNGIVATGGGAITTNITNSGDIIGLNGNGVQAQDSFVIINHEGAMISGTNRGIDATTTATITNHGEIFGTNFGIYVTDGATITNSATGTITGDVGIEAYSASGVSTFGLTNTGTITGTGGKAIDGVWGTDTIMLGNGSYVDGDILLNRGDDTLTMQTGGDLSVVNGRIDGGRGIDDLNLIGGLDEMLDFSGYDNFDGDMIDALRGSDAIVIFGDAYWFQTLDKSGAGLALITGFDDMNDEFVTSGDNQIDAINLTAGSLYINGNLDATPLQTRSVITASASATELGGAGTWYADITMGAGSFSAGQIAMNYDWDLLNNDGPYIDSIGDLDVYGNLTFNSGSVLRYDLDPVSGDSDTIEHFTDGGGVVTFNSGSSVSLSPSDINAVVQDGTYVLLTSDSAITGLPSSVVGVQFNANVEDTGFAGSLVPPLSGVQTATVTDTNLTTFTEIDTQPNMLGDDLIAIVTHNYEGLLGDANPNLASFGAAVDDSTDSLDPDVQDFIAALDYSDEATAVATAAALSPESQINKSVAILNSNYRVHRSLENHLAGARNAGSKGDVVRQQVSSSGKESVASSPVLMSSNYTLWGSISHDVQDYEASATNTDYDGNATAFTAGMDWRVSPTLVVGMMLDGSVGDYDYTGGSSDIESLRIAAYGTWGEATGLYSDFAVGYGDHSMDDDRNFGGILGGTNSSTDATSLQALATIGYAMQAGTIKHGPFAGLEYQNMDVDGFNINNAVIPLTVGDYTVESIRALIGYRAETTYGKFSPFASIAYAHEFGDEDVIVNAALAGSPFAVTTDGPGSAILLGLGTGYMINESLNANIGYRGEITVDSQGMDSHGINMGLDWSF